MDINYNENSNILIIKASFIEAEFTRALPNRRFLKRLGAWSAPCIRLNAMVIDTWSRQRHTFSPEAEAAIKLSIKGLKTEQVNFPTSMILKTTPYEHQQRGLDHVYNLAYSALFVEMGLGKSKVALDKMACHFFEGKITGVMIVCPAALRSNWLDEIHVHCSVPSLPLIPKLTSKRGNSDAQNFVHKPTDKMKILLVGIESLSSAKGKIYPLVEAYLKNNQVGVVVDEAHTIKTDSAARTTNLISLTPKAPYKMIMTGTPITQSLMDLYSQFQFLNPDIIGVGDFWSFKSRYAVMGGFENRSIIGFQNSEELLDTIKPFVFQCTKKEAVTLPDRTYHTRWVAMTKEQTAFYKELKRESVACIPNGDGATLRVVCEYVLVLDAKLKQVASGFIKIKDDFGNTSTTVLIDPKNNPKIKELKSIIEGIPDNEPILIWASFLEEIEMIRSELTGFRTGVFEKDYILFKGGMSDDQRDAAKTEFNAGKARYFISTQMTGGTGLTLNASCYTIYYSNTFSYLHRKQSQDRNHRIGQTRKVTYIDIFVEKSTDLRVQKAIAAKGDLADYVRGRLEAGLDVYNDDEL
tara:strand:- start:4271 stop:6007 length:1737 start_codon:yes stop_codon:yes gene_type:complete